MNPTVVMPAVLTLSCPKVPTDVNDEFTTPLPNVLLLRTELELIL
jgi:hypothetical protein